MSAIGARSSSVPCKTSVGAFTPSARSYGCAPGWAARPEGEAMEDDDRAELLMRSGGHERVHPAAAEAEHGHPRLIHLAD